MGGQPAPVGFAFPTASEPNPVANGLRGQGPMTIINPTTPATNQQPPPAPIAPSGTTPASGPTGPVGTPYTYAFGGNVISPYNSSIGQQYGPNAMYYPSGTNIPAGYSMLGYYDPASQTNYGLTAPNANTGALYQFNPYGSTTAPESNAFQQMYQGSPYASQGTFLGQAGPGSAPFFFGAPSQSNPLSAFYTGAAYKTPGYNFSNTSPASAGTGGTL